MTQPTETPWESQSRVFTGLLGDASNQLWYKPSNLHWTLPAQLISAVMGQTEASERFIISFLPSRKIQEWRAQSHCQEVGRLSFNVEFTQSHWRSISRGGPGVAGLMELKRSWGFLHAIQEMSRLCEKPAKLEWQDFGNREALLALGRRIGWWRRGKL